MQRTRPFALAGTTPPHADHAKQHRPLHNWRPNAAAGCATGDEQGRMRGSNTLLQQQNLPVGHLALGSALGGLERVDLFGRYGFNLNAVLIGGHKARHIKP